MYCTVPLRWLSNELNLLRTADIVAVTAGGNTVTLDARIGTTHVRTWTQTDNLRPGSATVPSTLLSDIARALEVTPVVLEHANGHLAVLSGSFSATISVSTTQVPAEYVIGPDVTGSGSMLSADMQQAIRDTLQIAPRASSPSLPGGMLLEASETGLRLVATDGYRLATTELPASIDKPFTAILSHSFCQEAGKLLGAGRAGIRYDGQRIQIDSGSRQLSAPVVLGKFPDYRRIMPKERDWQATASREKMLSGIASVVAASVTPAFSISVEPGSMTMATDEAKMTMATMTTTKRSFYANPKFVTDALNRVSSTEIQLSGDSNARPFLVSGLSTGSVRSTYLIMPIVPPAA